MRKLCRVLMALPLLSLSINVCLAQNTQLPVEQKIERLKNLNQFQKSQFGDQYYLLITFKELPGKEELSRLAQNQVKLLEYHSKNTYLAAIPADLEPATLKSLNITAVTEVPREKKADSRLLQRRSCYSGLL